ncbi:hypothetical protein DFJ74DRAFT_711744 [Hyaloraphidium curvatum]|nr:hypothetical protein DFJ74DRAFT_711744 [Hyaloraphidium curvatum]
MIRLPALFVAALLAFLALAGPPAAAQSFSDLSAINVTLRVQSQGPMAGADGARAAANSQLETAPSGIAGLTVPGMELVNSAGGQFSAALAMERRARDVLYSQLYAMLTFDERMLRRMNQLERAVASLTSRIEDLEAKMETLLTDPAR